MSGYVLDSFYVEVLLGALTLGWAWFYFWVKKRHSYFAERGVPYLKPTFLLGNTFQALIARKTLAASFTEIYKEFGPSVRIGGVYQGLRPTYVVKDPPLVHDVLIKDFSHFHDRGFKVDEKTNPLEGHLFLLNGGKWRVLRNKLSPTFTSGKLKWMFSQMDACSEALLKMVEEEVKTGKDLEIKDILCRFTTDVIGSCAFGYEPSAIKDPNCEFRRIGRKIFEPGLKDVILAVFRFSFPEVFFKLKIKTVNQEIHDFITSVTTQTFEHRLKSKENRSDFVQLLLQLREKGSIDSDPKDYQDDDLVDLKETKEGYTKEEITKIELTDELLTAQAFVFFAAGFETSATSMSFAVYMMAKHPEEQEKCRQEIRRVKKENGGKITYDSLKSMTYLDACFNETVRIFPPIGVLNRECTKTYVAQDGTKIEKGTAVVIPVAAIHNDPSIFPEPQLFKPERFLGEGPPPGTFMPFGQGPRICIAKRFAVVEVKLGLAKMLDRFEITLSPKQREPIRMNNRAFVLQPLDGIWVKLKPLAEQTS